MQFPCLKAAFSRLFLGLSLFASLPAGSALAQRSVADLIKQDAQEEEEAAKRAQRFLNAVQSILKDTSRQRQSARHLPSEKDYLIIAPPWTETREDRENKIRQLLDSALEVVTDVPIVKTQKRIRTRKEAIAELKDQIAQLEEKKLTAPKDALLPGILTDTVDSINHDIKELRARIDANQTDITLAKQEIRQGLKKAGLRLEKEQVELMLDSVLGGDMVRIAAAFEAVKSINSHLSRLVAKNADNVKISRQYFAMHTALSPSVKPPKL